MKTKSFLFTCLFIAFSVMGARATPWLSEIIKTRSTLNIQQQIEIPGILSTKKSGIPESSLANENGKDLASAVAQTPTDLLPASASFLRRFLLTELDAPTDSESFAKARIDYFLSIGALDEAEALLNEYEALSPELFNRKFDVALLIDRPDPLCEELSNIQTFKPTRLVEIFCLTQMGDWASAAIITRSVIALNQLQPSLIDLINWYLDPDYLEAGTILDLPNPITPLVFTLSTGTGNHFQLRNLPAAFLRSALNQNYPWRDRIYAAERLLANNAIPPKLLADLYMEAASSASGGIWDRVQSFQNIQGSIDNSDFDQNLANAINIFKNAGLLSVVSNHFSNVEIPTEITSEIRNQLLMLKAYDLSTPNPVTFDKPNEHQKLVAAIANRHPLPETSKIPLHDAIIDGLSIDTQKSPTGTELITAISNLAISRQSDLSKVTDSLLALRSAGFEATAHQAAVQFLVLSDQ